MLRPHLRVITAPTLGFLATGTVSSAAQEGWAHYAGDTFQRYSALAGAQLPLILRRETATPIVRRWI